jgi:catecholate siderophore receptor
MNPTKSSPASLHAAASPIKSRKHSAGSAPRLHGSALAVLATLAFPLSAHAGEAADAPIAVVKVTGHAERDVQAPVSSASDKFTAPLLDTPKSVTVIPSEVISQTGAVSLSDALRTVPGITIGAGEGGNPVGDNLFIRGYNAQTDTYIDGIRDSGSQSREIFNLEQIEVVKGPNSAYGGRSSAGGSVNLISKTAKTEDFSNATVGVGSAKYRRVTGDINRVIGENAAFRLNVMAHDADVAGRDVVTGKRWGIAPTVTFGLTGPTRAILSYYHMSSEEIPDSGLPFNNPHASGPLVRLNGDGTPVSVARGTFYGLVNRDFRDTTTDIGTIDLRHDFGNNLVLRNVTRYGKSTNDYVWTQPDDSKGNLTQFGTVWRRANSRNAETETAANATSLTGTLRTGSIKHSYTVGTEFSREKTDRFAYVFTPGWPNSASNCPSSGATTLYNCAPLNNPNPYDPWVATRSNSAAVTNVVTKTKSVYGFDTLEFTPKWLLNVGVRWDDYSSVLDTAAAGTTPAAHAESNSDFTSYQAGLVYKPSTNSSVYISYGTSSTPPGNDAGDGIDGLSAAIQTLKPQESKNFEVGTKWEVMPGGRLSVSAAYFESTMDNARVTSSTGAQDNIGKKEIKGVELGFSGNLSRNWQVFGGYTYLDAIVADNGYLNGAASPFNGNRFPTTPKHSASLWTTYQVTNSFTVGGGAFYVDKVFANVNNTKFAPSYTRFDAMASYAVNKNVSLQLNVQNLTDKLYYDRLSSPHYAGVGVGRTAILTANLKF